MGHSSDNAADLASAIKEGLRPVELELVNQWLADGKAVCVYENMDLSHPEVGHRQYITATTFAKAPWNGTPPETMPDTADRINWRYRLIGVYEGPAIS